MLAVMLLPERDCQKCTALQKRDWGCEKDAPIPMVMDGKDLYRCPRRPILDHPERYHSVLTAYKSYMRGYLPDAGSLQDQGYRYTVLMSVVENAVSEGEAEMMRRARTK